jgi:hypothetical protein
MPFKLSVHLYCKSQLDERGVGKAECSARDYHFKLISSIINRRKISPRTQECARMLHTFSID